MFKIIFAIFAFIGLGAIDAYHFGTKFDSHFGAGFFVIVVIAVVIGLLKAWGNSQSSSEMKSKPTSAVSSSVEQSKSTLSGTTKNFASVAPSSEVQPAKRHEDYYKILNLGPTSSMERIRNRCLELGQSCRPDVHGQDPIRKREFEQLERALDTLTNRRKEYDQWYQWNAERVAAVRGAVRSFERLIDTHAEDLLRKRRQLVVDTGYGKEDQSKWIAEKEYFFEEIVRPALGDRANLVSSQGHSRIDMQLNLQNLKGGAKKMPKTPPKTGIEFENHCAKILEQTGWKVSTTKASGDQGADIVAKQRGVSAVLQCKLYSKPVGNSAVQEAFAAKAHYGTKYAGVVSKSTYTKSAIALAASTEVLLLHFEDLPRLREKLNTLHSNPAST